MNFQVRKQIILSTLENKGSVDVRELAKILQTSDITVRRDLNILAEQSLLYRTHGGAMKLSLSHDPIDFLHKTAQKSEQKDEICQKVAQQIQDGEVIFLDCGSTVYRICPFIRHKRVKVVTNSLPIVNALLNSSVSLNFIGGEMDTERQATHGLIATEHIARYRADKALVGISGISLHHGLSAASEKEAEMTIAFAHQARLTYLLCDSSKFEKDSYFPFSLSKPLDFLVTDSQLSLEIFEHFQDKGYVFLKT